MPVRVIIDALLAGVCGWFLLNAVLSSWYLVSFSEFV